LIKKHEAFEKSAAAQEERFAALERLTTVRNSFSPFYNCIFLSQSLAYASTARYLSSMDCPFLLPSFVYCTALNAAIKKKSQLVLILL